MPSIKVRIPKENKIIVTRVPKPPKGTPLTTHLADKTKNNKTEKTLVMSPAIVMTLNGIYECAKIPLNARSITLKV
jgi:hypothetical protein